MKSQRVKVEQIELFSEAELESLEFVPEELEAIEVECASDLVNITFEDVAESLEAVPERLGKRRRTGRAMSNVRQPRGQRPQSPQQQGDFAQRILAAHNKYRAAVKVRPLTWSNKLAQSAQQWANRLAASGRFAHSQGQERGGAGENLWMGTAGRFSVTQMVDSWGNEKKFFVNRPSPNMSTTGKFADVGHYTQIVWHSTTAVGCAVARGQGKDYLVCHYNPIGNVTGRKAF